MALSPLDQIRGEMIASQIILQRILANIANSTGDYEGTLRRAHEQCLADLEKLEIQVDGVASEEIRAQAQSALDRMHTYLRKK